MKIDSHEINHKINVILPNNPKIYVNWLIPALYTVKSYKIPFSSLIYTIFFFQLYLRADSRCLLCHPKPHDAFTEHAHTFHGLPGLTFSSWFLVTDAHTLPDAVEPV